MGWDHGNFAQIRPVYAMMNPGALVAGKGNALLRIAYLRVGQMLRGVVRPVPDGGDYFTKGGKKMNEQIHNGGYQETSIAHLSQPYT
jgi:hypothetical protein